MNCKLEKFWNTEMNSALTSVGTWTVNLKSFEIKRKWCEVNTELKWTVNLKSFEIELWDRENSNIKNEL